MRDSQPIPRRLAIKWMVTATAAVSVMHLPGFGAAEAPAAAAPAMTGYGTDPKLLEYYRPGDVWPLTMTPEQRRTVAALCEVILPADEKSPAASSVGVPEFIDEWVSAPYPEQQADRKQILEGLSWLDKESRKRFQKRFADLAGEQQRQLCDDICHVPRAKRKFQAAARFFARFRNLAMSGFYTTPAGWQDLRYIGNVALTRFDGPPPEVLEYLGLK